MLAEAMLPAVDISFFSLCDQRQSVPAHKLITRTAFQPDAHKTIHTNKYTNTHRQTAYSARASQTDLPLITHKKNML